ncbi:MAG: AarF/UbiB family protein, partial [Chloroflexota bacterium]
PGNVILNLKDGSINFLDMGMMGYLDEESRRELGNMMIALQQPDTRELVRIGIRLGVTFKKVDERALRRQLEHILNRYMVASLSQVSFADMMYEMMDTFFEYGVRLPPELTLAIKSLIQTQEIASTLNPQLQIADIADTVSDQLFWEQFKPSVVQDRLNETTAEVLRLAPIAADAVERVLREAKSGKLTIQLDTSDLQTQLDALSENTKRVTVGLTVAGMTIGSAIAMSVNPEEAWSFIPVLGVIGFTVSIAVGGLLILKLLWEIWGP